jgi:CBS domain-containing protein
MSGEAMRVDQVMTTDVVSARPDTPLKEVARTLAERSISAMPVLDEQGRPIGIVSERDLLPRGHETPAAQGLFARLRGKPASRPAARVAADVMSSPAITIEPFWSIPGAAAIMRDRGVKRLVVTRQDRAIGIVSRGDIIRAVARDDAEVKREVRDLIAFHQGLWSDSLPVDVSVVDGETTLRGTVERSSMAEMLPKLVERIPGVLNVSSELTWQDDDRSPAGVRM